MKRNKSHIYYLSIHLLQQSLSITHISFSFLTVIALSGIGLQYNNCQNQIWFIEWRNSITEKLVICNNQFKIEKKKREILVSAGYSHNQDGYFIRISIWIAQISIWMELHWEMTFIYQLSFFYVNVLLSFKENIVLNLIFVFTYVGQ